LFKIKRTFLIILSVILLTVFFGCKSKNIDKNDVQGGEIVVIQDRSDTVLGAYNIDTLNPITTKSKSSQRITNIIYESLFTFNEEMNLEPVLAENYSVSSDGTSITVNLKPDVKWQNGSFFTANDVVYTLGKLTSNDGIYKKVADRIKSYTATGDYSVLIELYSPEPDFAYLLTFPVLSAETGFVSDDTFVPMGTGSYKLSSRTSTELYLEPNEMWHGGTPSEKKITVKILKDELTATNALNVKEIDAVALENYNQDTNIPKLNAVSKTITTNNMVFLGFNTQSPAMTQNIRRAVYYIVDKQKILDNNAYGKGKVCELSVNPDSWVSRLPENDKADADELISFDGYKMENGVYVKDAVPYCARILVNEDNILRCNIAQGIADILKASGLDTVVEAVSYQDYIAKINKDDFDMFVGEVEVMSNLNPGAMLDREDNYFNFDVSYLKDAKAELYGVAERDRVKEIMVSYRNRFYLNPPYLPLYFKSDVIIYGSYVSGVVSPTLFDTFKNIENWYFYDKDGSEQKTVEGEED